MSFGFGVGDVISVLELFERVAREVRQYHGAPRHFQELQAELGLMKSTLSHVLQIQPQSPDETASIEQIRAIALHCQQPLLDFIEKLRRREPTLGHFKTASTLATVGARLHWSLVSRADVDDLRRVLLSQMLALNVLLGTHQLQYLRSLEPCVTDKLSRAGDEMKAVSTKMDVLGELSKKTPSAIINLRGLILSQNAASSTQIARISQTCGEISDRVTALSLAATAGERLNKRLSRAVMRLFSVVQDIRTLLSIIQQYSQDVLGSIQKNASMLLSIQATMRRVAQGIESIPLHLSLPIIRLDDASGESWALPFQACSDYTAFKNTLEAVVFPDSRAGSLLVRSNMHALTFAPSRTAILTYQWSQVVKPGAHIQQAMITADSRGRDSCLFRGCCGQMTDSVLGDDKTGRICGKCGRSSIVELDDRIFDAQVDHGRPASMLHSSSNKSHAGPHHASQSSRSSVDSMKTFHPIGDEEWTRFRRTKTYHFQAIQTLDEALEALSKDGLDARANQFLGWWSLTQEADIWGAINHLENAIKSGINDTGQTWYLLGRAFMRSAGNRSLHRRRPEDEKLTCKAYECYQQSVYRNSRTPSYWVSIAVMYYVNEQARDSLDCLSRAMRLNPFQWETWYNLGVLYDSVSHAADALDAFQRCTQLNSECSRAVMRRTRLHQLLDPRTHRLAPVFAEMVEPPLDHVSHMLPERRSSLSFVLNPIEIADTDSGLENGRGELDMSGNDDYQESELSEDTDKEEWSGGSDHEDIDVFSDGDDFQSSQ